MVVKKFSKKRKICVVVASRANYGRIKSTLKAINANNALIGKNPPVFLA